MKSSASGQAAKHSFCPQYKQGENVFQHCQLSWVNAIVPAVFTRGELIQCWSTALLRALTAFLCHAISKASQGVPVPAEMNFFSPGQTRAVSSVFLLAHGVKPQAEKGRVLSI